MRLGLLYGLFLVAGVGQAAISPLLPHLSARYGLSASGAALLLALPGLATLAVSLPSGVAAERLGARPVTLAAGILLTLSSIAQALPSLPALLLGRVLFGVAFGVLWTTGLAWLSECDAAGGVRTGPAVTWSSVGITAGPAVGGVLSEHVGFAAPFWAMALLSSILLAGLFAAGTGDGATMARALPAAALQPVGSWSARLSLVRRPNVWTAAAALVVSGAVSSVSQLLISGGLHDAGVSTGRIGLAFSAAAVCFIAVSAAIVRLGVRAQTQRFNAIATAMLAVALIPALAGQTLALVAALMLSAGPRAAIGTTAYALAAREQPGRDGFLFGLLNGAWAAATVLMPLVAGALEQVGGRPAGYLAVIVPSCLLSAWLVAGGRRARRLAVS